MKAIEYLRFGAKFVECGIDSHVKIERVRVALAQFKGQTEIFPHWVVWSYAWIAFSVASRQYEQAADACASQ